VRRRPLKRNQDDQKKLASIDYRRTLQMSQLKLMVVS
jgi:hypothetical protein